MPPAPLADTRLRVRMYRVGFGDCFLLSLPVEGGHRHVLIDCGVHPSGDLKTFEQVFADIAAVTERRLALVVATHEHADHISGFGRFEQLLRNFDVESVWMSWAMDLADPKASSLRRARLALAGELQLHFRARGASEAARNALLNLQGNEPAMAALRSGFRGATSDVRYLQAGDSPPPPASLPNLSVRVLGPSRDDEFLKKMNPPRSQRYVRLDRGERVLVNGVSPFEGKYRREARVGRKLYGFPARSARDLSEKDLRELAAESLDGLAFTLDSIANNTSLVLLFEYRGRRLLFPGDAQWGSWKFWLDQEGAASLLEQVDFLKVSHHGSFNATPRSALEGLRTGAFAALVSTQSLPFPTIPQPALMKRLGAKTKRRVVRSDSLAIPSLPDAPRGPRLRTLPRDFGKGELWIDWTSEV
jgi:beta-lactamase superfamily II metal-dependent hydrolase